MITGQRCERLSVGGVIPLALLVEQIYNSHSLYTAKDIISVHLFKKRENKKMVVEQYDSKDCHLMKEQWSRGRLKPLRATI